MEYIQTEAELETAISRLRGVPLLAADTEAAGYHRYEDRVCLLQLSTRADNLVIDTLSLEHLGGLAPLLADPDVEVVFHDADYDLRLLQRDFGLTVRGIFDTKIAAQFVGETAFGLASLVEKYLGTRLEKAFQRADWARRPLPPEMLEYAAGDTEYLPALRDALREALEETGRLAWAEEEFRLEESVRWAPAEANGEGYLRLKNTRDLRPRQLAALRELYEWREGVARSRDVAPFRVLTNDVLVEIARRLPGSWTELAGIPGAPRSLAERYGQDLLAALERARRLREGELPVRPRGPRRPPPDPEFDELVERLRQVRDEAAEGLGLDRGFLMPRAQLEELARQRPSSIADLEAIPGFRHWQAEAVGGELITALRRWRP
jgi:ribonuclease D